MNCTSSLFIERGPPCLLANQYKLCHLTYNSPYFLKSVTNTSLSTYREREVRGRTSFSKRAPEQFPQYNSAESTSTNLYQVLIPYIRYGIHSSVSSWQEQEADIIEDIVQSEVFLYRRQNNVNKQLIVFRHEYIIENSSNISS